MILSPQDIRELLTKKMEELKKNPDAEEILKTPYVHFGIQNIELLLEENRSPSNEELDSFRNLGMFAARELGPNNDNVAGLLSEIGSLGTRLSS